MNTACEKELTGTNRLQNISESAEDTATNTANAGTGGKELPKSGGEKQAAAALFAKRWADAGESEIGETQTFWGELLRDVFGVTDLKSTISFEKQVYVDGHSRRIDGFITLNSWDGTSRILIEQKKRAVDMDKAEPQSDEVVLTPYQQAKRYYDALPLEEKPRWIITCNFKEFRVYDMNVSSKDLGRHYEQVLLKNFESDWWRLEFLADADKEVEKRQLAASEETGQLIGDLYELLLSKCLAKDNPATLRSLNIFCVRLVFCFYAEDTGLFGSRTLFDDYVKATNYRQLRVALARLFTWLDTPDTERNPYDVAELEGFPYADGGLFAEHDVEIPFIDGEVKSMILKCGDADWSGIDPVIFGSIFESTLNPATRREGGMHYTSPENIDKALNPLFMDDLTAELEGIKAIAGKKARDAKLHAFQENLATLKFLDPACGSGNFLTRAYTRLRTLENDAILAMSENADIKRGQAALGNDRSVVKVSIDQFYGIEINDFAVNVAKTALWIAERQMLEQTAQLLGRDFDFLPIMTRANIAEGNALTLDWGTLEGAKAGLTVEDTLFAGAVEAGGERLSFDYIVGNPPFVGYSFQNDEQKADLLSVCTDDEGKPLKRAGKIDYVAGWYYKAVDFIKGSSTSTRCAFVSTNSITQGEQVAVVWQELFRRGVHIDFAYRTFKWQSESTDMAEVHCVIVGFSVAENSKPKVIYEERVVKKGKGEEERELVAITAHNINAYLADAPDVFIESRTTPLCDVPEMNTGNRPADGGFLIIEKDRVRRKIRKDDKDEEGIELESYDEFVKREPKALPYIKRLVGSEEFINGKERWCLWLVGVSDDDVTEMPLVMRRIKLCKANREAAPDEGRRKLAKGEAVRLFRETLSLENNYVVIPKVSSEQRLYIPMGLMTPDIICTDLLFVIPDATLYHFGVLTSSVHMAWMRAVAGRLEMRYRYSKDIVYNNFVWSTPTDEQRSAIEASAQAILDARANHPKKTLADLYGENMFIYSDLVSAHEANDRAVLAAYGWEEDTQEADIVSRLMELYQQKVGG